MTASRRRLPVLLTVFAATFLAVSAPGAGRATAAEENAYDVEVGNLTAKVGEETAMRATLRIRDGYRILQHYNNRVIELSSYDDGVAFEHKVVKAQLEDGALVFVVGLRATKPGRHPINGVFRVGYMHGTDEMAMVSLRLIASVTGTP